MKVLFIGNSHTYFNDMPQLFADMVESTVGERPEVTMLAYSGRDYKWHRKEYFSIRFNLMYGHYDYCILQQAAHPYPEIAETLEYGKELIDLCHAYGVTPVVYMTWAEKRFPENQQKMIDTCKKLAEENNALLAPIGAIWQKVQKEHPEIELYFRDGEHAGPYGDYLIAATFCKTITGKLNRNMSNKGYDFLKNLTPDFERPVFIENLEDVEIELDRNKTDIIIKTVIDYE